jgi:hypothetical protein
MKPWAILPVKEMAGAKQRLAPLLSPEERIGLMQVMLRDVLMALAAAQGLAGIAVVTLDPWAQALAQRLDPRLAAMSVMGPEAAIDKEMEEEKGAFVAIAGGVQPKMLEGPNHNFMARLQTLQQLTSGRRIIRDARPPHAEWKTWLRSLLAISFSQLKSRGPTCQPNPPASSKSSA